MPGAIVIGAGPGIGVAVARRFAREGLPVGVVARSPATVDAALAALVDAEVDTYGAVADATDEAGLRAALDGHVERLGVPDVLVYNAAIIQWDRLGELTAAQHLEAWAVNVVGAITTAAHVLPRMADAGGGTFLITSGMPTPVSGVLSLSLGKAGVRALAEALHAQFRPLGVHVSAVTVAGAVGPGSAFDPDEIAEQYWRLHVQQPQDWEHELVYLGRPAASAA